MYLDNKLDENSNEISGRVKRTKVPPPPILLCKTDSSMVFKPAQFIPSGGEKVWKLLSEKLALAVGRSCVVFTPYFTLHCISASFFCDISDRMVQALL